MKASAIVGVLPVLYINCSLCDLHLPKNITPMQAQVLELCGYCQKSTRTEIAETTLDCRLRWETLATGQRSRGSRNGLHYARVGSRRRCVKAEHHQIVSRSSKVLVVIFSAHLCSSSRRWTARCDLEVSVWAPAAERWKPTWPAS